MKNLLKSLLESKKAMVMLLSIAAMLLAKLGWSVDGEQLYLFLAPALTYILAQGWADKGKEAAKVAVAAEASKADPDPS